MRDDRGKLAIQRRTAGICILEIEYTSPFYNEGFLICEAGEVRCTLKDLPFRAIVVSYPQACRLQGRGPSTSGVAGGRRAGQIPRAYLIAAQWIDNAFIFVYNVYRDLKIVSRHFCIGYRMCTQMCTQTKSEYCMDDKTSLAFRTREPLNID